MLPSSSGLTTTTSDASLLIIMLGLKPKGSASGRIEGVRLALFRLAVPCANKLSIIE